MRISGDQLKIIRVMFGLRKIDVSNVLERYSSAVTYYENGNRLLSEEQSQKVKEAFGITNEMLWSMRQTIKIMKGVVQ